MKFENKIIFLLLLAVSTTTYSSSGDKVVIKIGKNEFWWGGLSSQGYQMPYDITSKVTHELWANNEGNQAQPLLLSSEGRYIWCEEPINYSFDKGELTVTSLSGKIVQGKKGNNIYDAYTYVSQLYFPSNGKIPDEKLFLMPQYNTWIELMYDQNENNILKYAQDIIDNGFPPGVLMIDDNWQVDYGTWDFAPPKFKNPKAMIEKLHTMGFKVMLWVCPFVSADSEMFRYLAKEGLLVLDKDKTQNILWANTQNKAAIIRWWNGASGCLDLSNPKAIKWFKEKLDFLVNEYGVDGYKFDAGDSGFYKDVVSYNVKLPNDHTAHFAELGLNFPLNEYRASWKMAGLPLAQRLRDKTHSWDDLGKLIPDMMSQSLMGYTYTCPDMIGGGEYQSFLKTEAIDQELIVRSAQIHALMPMMQFSVAPWRVLSKENLEICLNMAKLHQRMGSKILELAKQASTTSIPIVKPLELVFPNQGYETVKDQFMFGNDILVAPIVKKGAEKRFVVLPKGKWKSEKGEIYAGGKIIEIEASIKRLPYFEKIK